MICENIFSANKVIIIVTTKMIIIKIIIAEKLKGPPSPIG